MRPPICAVCHARFPMSEGGLVRFADYEPLPERMVGHPRGLEWFCGDHIEAAKEAKYLNTAEAVAFLRAG